MHIFEGACVALVTPFQDEHSVNVEALKILLDYQIENGTDAILVNGTTGEPATMTKEEKHLVIETTLEQDVYKRQTIPWWQRLPKSWPIENNLEKSRGF